MFVMCIHVCPGGLELLEASVPHSMTLAAVYAERSLDTMVELATHPYPAGIAPFPVLYKLYRL